MLYSQILVKDKNMIHKEVIQNKVELKKINPSRIKIY